ncbi:hypothetical protein H5T51_06115 [Candidatus Bathyarchaeota archaeon]|nr:hypothetical protein [Candidatus Bathyarchaeota archaeon]
MSHIIYVVNGVKAEEVLGRNWEELLKRAAYSIIAVGGKEGLTSAQNVEISEAQFIKDESVRTINYIPKGAVVDYTPRSICEEEFWDHSESSPHWSNRSRNQPERIPYILPIDKITLTPIIVEARPSNDGLALTTDGFPKNNVILLRKWVS